VVKILQELVNGGTLDYWIQKQSITAVVGTKLVYAISGTKKI
jgi:hypothetical protein